VGESAQSLGGGNEIDAEVVHVAAPLRSSAHGDLRAISRMAASIGHGGAAVLKPGLRHRGIGDPTEDRRKPNNKQAKHQECDHESSSLRPTGRATHDARSPERKSGLVSVIRSSAHLPKFGKLAVLISSAPDRAPQLRSEV
jgi:hypothetical protein